MGLGVGSWYRQGADYHDRSESKLGKEGKGGCDGGRAAEKKVRSMVERQGQLIHRRHSAKGLQYF